MHRVFSRPQIFRRSFAQALDTVPITPIKPPPSVTQEHKTPRALDTQVLHELHSQPSATSFAQLLDDYDTNGHAVLNTFLKYEPTPGVSRRIDFENEASGVVGLSHVIDAGEEHKIAFCSGFMVHAEGYPSEKVVVSCAHTLEEVSVIFIGRESVCNTSNHLRPSQMRRSPVLDALSRPETRSATLLFHGKNSITPASRIVSCLPKSDLILFAADLPSSVRSLPVSPYPVHAGTNIRAHFVTEKEPVEEGWRPWINGTWSKWVKGKVVGYRDFAGRQAEVSTLF